MAVGDTRITGVGDNVPVGGSNCPEFVSMEYKAGRVGVNSDG